MIGAGVNRLLVAMTSLGLMVGSGAAQEPTKGAVNPLASLPLVQDADVACLQSALEAGNPRAGPLDLDCQGAGRLRRALALAKFNPPDALAGAAGRQKNFQNTTTQAA
jgi:hypothetical protein